MPNLRNGTKRGFEPGLSRLRVRHSTTELPRSTKKLYSYIPHLTDIYDYTIPCTIIYARIRSQIFYIIYINMIAGH